MARVFRKIGSWFGENSVICLPGLVFWEKMVSGFPSNGLREAFGGQGDISFFAWDALAAQDMGVVPDPDDEGGFGHGFPPISASIAATAARNGTTSTVAAVQITPASTSS